MFRSVSIILATACRGQLTIDILRNPLRNEQLGGTSIATHGAQYSCNLVSGSYTHGAGLLNVQNSCLRRQKMNNSRKRSNVSFCSDNTIEHHLTPRPNKKRTHSLKISKSRSSSLKQKVFVKIKEEKVIENLKTLQSCPNLQLVMQDDTIENIENIQAANSCKSLEFRRSGEVQIDPEESVKLEENPDSGQVLGIFDITIVIEMPKKRTFLQSRHTQKTDFV